MGADTRQQAHYNGLLNEVESQRDSGPLGQYGIRFASSSASTDFHKSHRSQQDHLPPALGPQNPAICPRVPQLTLAAVVHSKCLP